MVYLKHLSDLVLDMSPWLLVGLLAAGFVKAWLPEKLVARWLGGLGAGPVVRGALVGAPLPLCSCSVIPVAMGLYRNGASKPATVSFLVSTPETGVDSVILSWTLLGPFMTVARPVTAIFSSIFTGLMAGIFEYTATKQHSLRVSPPPAMSITGKRVATAATPEAGEATSDCGESRCGCSSSKPAKVNATHSLGMRAKHGIAYALSDLWDDIAPWIAGGVVLAAIVQTWIPPGDLQGYTGGSGLAMLFMVLVSVPVYVCATASTPIAAAMLYSGVTPGMTLAFLIAGPATNLAPLVILQRELGWRTMSAYLFGIIVSALASGLLVDWIAQSWNLAPIPATILGEHVGEWIPIWLAVASTIILAVLSLRSILAKRKGTQPAGMKVRQLENF